MAKFVVGVHSVIFDNQRQVLLVHRRDMDLWDLPGGGMEAGETPSEAASREVKEETGLDVEIDDLLAVGVGIPPENVLGFLFLARVSGGQITIGVEADQVCYFAVNQLPENLGPRKRAMIELAAQNPEKVVFNRITLPKAQQYLQVYGNCEDQT
jgi:ADP-ribose pyrophosphatase YjhB (NUDIX family)